MKDPGELTGLFRLAGFVARITGHSTDPRDADSWLHTCKCGFENEVVDFVFLLWCEECGERIDIQWENDDEEEEGPL